MFPKSRILPLTFACLFTFSALEALSAGTNTLEAVQRKLDLSEARGDISQREAIKLRARLNVLIEKQQAKNKSTASITAKAAIKSTGKGATRATKAETAVPAEKNDSARVQATLQSELISIDHAIDRERQNRRIGKSPFGTWF